MSKQLRLVETTEPAPRRRARPSPPSGRADVDPASRGSRGRWGRWDSEWRLSPKARRIGLEGVTAAREALTRHRVDEDLSDAS